MSVHKLTLACLAAAVFPAAFGLDAYAQAVAITNARIHTITGPVIDNGTVVILENRIEDVGADIVPPDGARIIDAMGRIVTPGFLDSHTFLGLSEIDRSAGPNTVSTSSERLTSGYRLLDGLDPQSTTIPVTRVEGISRAVVAPRPGAAADVPAVIRPMENIPSMETPGATLENAARLDAAGVTVAFASYAAHSARNLMQYAGNAVSHGMGYDAALRAVTRVPAEIWGIGDRYRVGCGGSGSEPAGSTIPLRPRTRFASPASIT